MNTCLGDLRHFARATAVAALILLPLGLAAQNAPAGDVQKGQTAFNNHKCSGCHGVNGDGAIGPRIAPPGRPFPDFVKYVRTPAGMMSSFTAQAVPDSDLADIYAYLRSKTSPIESAFSAGPGNAQHGKQIYTAYGCYQCHGGQGQGSVQTGALRIGPPALFLSAFAAYIRQPAKQMPPYTAKAVSDQDVVDIYAFLQTIPAPPPAKSIPLLNQ